MESLFDLESILKRQKINDGCVYSVCVCVLRLLFFSISEVGLEFDLILVNVIFMNN